MIMITSKGQLPGDFGRFYYKKSQAKGRCMFFNEKFFLQNDTLEATFNSLTTLTGWADGGGMGWGFLGTKKKIG